VAEAADEAALFKRIEQAMDIGLAGDIQGVGHLLE
jgi:hypothetical protein